MNVDFRSNYIFVTLSDGDNGGVQACRDIPKELPVLCKKAVVPIKETKWIRPPVSLVVSVLPVLTPWYKSGVHAEFDHRVGAGRVPMPQFTRNDERRLHLRCDESGNYVPNFGGLELDATGLGYPSKRPMDLRVLMRESPASHDTLVQARYPCRQDRGCPITANSELPDTVPRMVSMMNSELHNSVGAGRYDETGNYTSTFGGPGLSATATVRHRVYSMEGSYLYQFGTVTVGNWHSQVSMMNCTTVSGLAEYPYYRLHGPITNNCELPETVPRMVQFYMAVNVHGKLFCCEVVWRNGSVLDSEPRGPGFES
ncbi:hypothetical protein Bbelb_303840 [Branchiostoma belcheri]|nr:hypothetical protein Bbelb_303840 [Branchiostoma belcheri]